MILIFFYSRLDLRPNDGETDATAVDGEAPMAPPLDAEAAAAAGAAEASTDATATGNRRRATRLFDLHRLRHATVEERIEALRRFRVENQAENGAEGSATASSPAAARAPSPADNGDEATRERLTKRLRDKFRIRTRAQEPGSSSRN